MQNIDQQEIEKVKKAAVEVLLHFPVFQTLSLSLAGSRDNHPWHIHQSTPELCDSFCY